MKVVEIPGGVARLRESMDLRGRDRLLIKAAAIAAAPAIGKLPPDTQDTLPGETPDELATRRGIALAGTQFTWQEAQALLELRQATMVALLESWTRPEPLPTMATIGDLPADLYDALDVAIGGQTMPSLGPDFEPASGTDGRPDSDSPTSASSPSEPSSPVAVGPEAIDLTPRPQSAGASIATESFTRV